jgi:hypothetical protein
LQTIDQCRQHMHQDDITCAEAQIGT